MKYLIALLVLVVMSCSTSKPVVLMNTGGVTVYGCEDECNDSLGIGSVAYQTFDLDTLDYESMMVLQKEPDTVRIQLTDTLVVAPTVLCTDDDLATKRVEWQLAGWVLSDRPIATGGVFSDRKCLAGTRK